MMVARGIRSVLALCRVHSQQGLEIFVGNFPPDVHASVRARGLFHNTQSSQPLVHTGFLSADLVRQKATFGRRGHCVGWMMGAMCLLSSFMMVRVSSSNVSVFAFLMNWKLFSGKGVSCGEWSLLLQVAKGAARNIANAVEDLRMVEVDCSECSDADKSVTVHCLDQCPRAFNFERDQQFIWQGWN
jgi:hypothetical protein